MARVKLLFVLALLLLGLGLSRVAGMQCYNCVGEQYDCQVIPTEDALLECGAYPRCSTTLMAKFGNVRVARSCALETERNETLMIGGLEVQVTLCGTDACNGRPSPDASPDFPALAAPVAPATATLVLLSTALALALANALRLHSQSLA